MDPKGKVVVVTGAGSGLGLASCRAFAAAGARVYGFERDVMRLDQIYRAGPSVKANVVDVSDETSISSAISGVLDDLGAMHIVVNCAGILKGAKTLSKGEVFPLETWNEVIKVNLTGTFNALRFSALAMIKNPPDAETGERGVFIAVSSGAAWQGQVGQVAYSASKAGVIGLTLPAARDLAEHGIRVVTIAPGLFDTAMAADMSPKASEGILDRMVLYPKRRGRPEEFARLALHIVENEYLNATTIALDAGTRMMAR